MAEFILKDRHGNSRTFDKETFYVRGADGELMPFTHGTGNPVLQPLTITENGTYTAPEGVDGYNPVTVEVDPTKITILKEQEISGFALDEEFGYIKNEVQTYTVNIGEKYFVIWDGVTYETTALAADSFVEGAVFLGNGTMLGLPGNDEPFAIGYANDMIMYLAFTDPSESHTVGIYQKVSGGSSEDVRYVTFKNHDDTIEYGKKAVAVGDDCADPIARGVFATPTRESDAQYNYTFYGWATEPNGGADANWNKAVTEDKTVYANFTSAVRYYTITYYDSDGTTVLKTESLAYGSMPSYVGDKEGVGFGGWTPEPVPVMGNASYTAKWVEVITFANASWADIARISESGEASKYFKVGETKQFSYYGGMLTVAIAGFDHDDKADGTGKAGISLVCMNLPNVKTAWASSYYSTMSYPYSSSKIKTLLDADMFTSLPSELQAVIKPVIKLNDGSAQKADNNIIESTEKLWLLSLKELGKTQESTGYILYGDKYELFNAHSGKDGYDVAFTVVTNESQPSNPAYWTRQCSLGSWQSAYIVTLYTPSSGPTGLHTSHAKTNQSYIRFGFCI